MGKAGVQQPIQWKFIQGELSEPIKQQWEKLFAQASMSSASSHYNFASKSNSLLKARTNPNEIIYALGYQAQNLVTAISLFRKPISLLGIKFQSIQLIAHDHLDLYIATGQNELDVNHLLASLIEALRQQLTKWHFFLGRRWYFSELPQQQFLSPVYSRPAAFFEFSQTDTVDRIISKKMLKNIRRCERKLATDISPPRLIKHLHPADVDAALAAFYSLEAAGWKGKAGSAISCNPLLSQFYVDNWHYFSTLGMSRIYQLKIADSVVGACIAFQHKTHLFLHKITFDETLSNYGPGSILVKQIIEDTLESGEITSICFNTCPEWISRWHPQIKLLSAVQAFNKNVGGRLCQIILHSANFLKLRKRKLLTNSKIRESAE